MPRPYDCEEESPRNQDMIDRREQEEHMPIQIWSYTKAPREYKSKLIADDCDWIVFVPYGFPGGVPEFLNLNTGSDFGCCDVVMVEDQDGFLFAGYHA